MNPRSRRTLLAALAFLTPALTSAEDWTIYLRRAGPVRIGMSLADVRRVLHKPSARLEGNEPDIALSECAWLQNAGTPPGLGVMFAKDLVVRIDVRKAGIRTASGAGIGDSEDRIKRLYPGHITVEPHHYDAAGHYLYYKAASDPDRNYGIIFETDGKAVTSFRVGTLEAIGLVEGCS